MIPTPTSEFEWLPAYHVKRHQRAKHVKLRYSLKRGLCVTVPPRFNLKQLPSILVSHRDWIVKQMSQPRDDVVFPTRIELPLLNQVWLIVYEPKQGKPRLRELRTGELILNVDEGNVTQVTRLLKAWLRRKAEQVLPPLFSSLSETLGLPFRSLSIRSQSSVWGSCSHDQSIRLNDRLLFFPQPLARHIMIHELCHTKFMNHSAAFWALVRSYDPEYLQHKKICRTFQNQLPRWAH